MKKNLFCFFIVFTGLNGLFCAEESKIDWITGYIYSSVIVTVSNSYDFAHDRQKKIEEGKDKAKINYYRILGNLNLSATTSILDYIQNAGNKNRELFSLIENAHLHNIEYPSLDTIKLTYFIKLYGEENSLMDIIMEDDYLYTADLKSYMGYNYQNDYTGIVIDARGILTTFDTHRIKVNPSVYVAVKDSEGRTVFNQFNVYPHITRQKGMVRYSYDINEDLEERVGPKPLHLVAYGAGDKLGAIIVISVPDAKRILSSASTKSAIQNGKIAIIIDE